jgi:hypothetical protein
MTRSDVYLSKTFEEREAYREKEQRFFKYLRGWRGYWRGESICPCYGWPEEDRKLYKRGWQDAQNLSWALKSNRR